MIVSFILQQCERHYCTPDTVIAALQHGYWPHGTTKRLIRETAPRFTVAQITLAHRFHAALFRKWGGIKPQPLPLP